MHVGLAVQITREAYGTNDLDWVGPKIGLYHVNGLAFHVAPIKKTLRG